MFRCGLPVRAEAEWSVEQAVRAVSEKQFDGQTVEQAVRAVSEAAEGKDLAKGLLDRGFGYVRPLSGFTYAPVY